MSTTRSLILVAVFVSLVTVLNNAPPAPAQPAKATTATRAEPMGTVEIYEAKDGFRFRVKGLDGKVLAQPAKGQKTKEDCMKSLETIKAILNSGKVIEIKK